MCLLTRFSPAHIKLLFVKKRLHGVLCVSVVALLRSRVALKVAQQAAKFLLPHHACDGRAHMVFMVFLLGPLLEEALRQPDLD